MVTDFVRPESMEVPEGGLASFLTATVGEWAEATEDNIPQTGIAGVKSVADQLADYGRHEDSYMIHAAEGETVIPMAVLDGDPRLKASLFAQMRAMGLDPQRYVVGNELNSINPVTGQPEFFLSKLWKGLKKAVKGVVKVVKKLAPIILSVGLSMIPGVGPILGSALGSGIGTLIQGGNLKDALKMAAIGGATAGIFKGIGGGIKGMKANQGFGTGFKAGVTSGLPGAAPYNPIQSPSVSASLQPVADPLYPDMGNLSTQNPLKPVGGPTPSAEAFRTGPVTYGGTPGGTQAQIPGFQSSGQTLLPPQSQLAGMPSAEAFRTRPVTYGGASGGTQAQIPGFTAQGPAASSLPKPTIIDDIAYTNDNTFMQLNDVVDPTVIPPAVDPTVIPPAVDTTAITPAVDTTAITPVVSAAEALRPRTTWESVKDIFTPGGKGFFEASKDFLLPSSVTPTEIVAQQLGVANPAGATFASLSAENIVTPEKLSEMITVAASLLKDNAAALGGGYNPGFLQKWGPLAAAGTGIMAATGGFEEQPMEPVDDPWGGKTGFDLLRADPAKYSVFPAYGGPYSVPGGASGGDVQKQCVGIPQRNTGGNFPRRDGAISGPGTGTSDDIRAMLSDGEFVMTADAVRGAGNGDRRRGVRKMYEVMRGFEGVA